MQKYCFRNIKLERIQTLKLTDLTYSNNLREKKTHNSWLCETELCLPCTSDLLQLKMSFSACFKTEVILEVRALY